jgi:uncharacterized HAD superfamily protein
MKVFSMVDREYVEVTMRAGLERLGTITDLMCMVDYSRDSIEVTLKSLDAENIEDTKDYLKSNISRLDTYMELVNEEMYKIEKLLNGLINKE